MNPLFPDNAFLDHDGDTIRVLVVDDTAFMRKAVTQVLETDPMLKIVGTAVNGLDALRQIRDLKPDVITLDIDMPVMDGLTAIRHIMIEMPMPIVVLSSLVTDGAVTFDALRLGVVDFVPKPSGAISVDIDKSRQQLIDRVKIAYSMRLCNVRRVKIPKNWKSGEALQAIYHYYPLEYLVVIGTTLSGPNTVIRLLTNLPPTIPAAVVVLQEISPKILPAFTKRFDETVPWKVVRAEDKMLLEQGTCYICSNEYSLGFDLDDKSDICLSIENGIPYPLDYMFTSAAEFFHRNTIGVLLSGVGDDGAGGFANIKREKGVTIAKDAQCCVFPNLTDNAVKQKVVDKVLDDHMLASDIQSIILHPVA